ncbi:MAG: dipeptidase PepE [bacterium]
MKIIKFVIHILKKEVEVKKVFLISSSRYQGGKFWGHCLRGLKDFLGPAVKEKKKIVFIPYAKADGDYDSYTKMVSEPFAELGYDLVDINSYPARDCFSDPTVVAICIGGGNTWALTYWLHEHDLLLRIMGKVYSGEWKYVSASAGTVVACQSMMTTNDMAPVIPKSDKTLDLVPFQINPHFVPGSLMPGHMGETREERISQVLTWNPDWTVVGLPEGCWIDGEGDNYILCGTGQAVIFRKDGNNSIWLPGESFDPVGML